MTLDEMSDLQIGREVMVRQEKDDGVLTAMGRRVRQLARPADPAPVDSESVAQAAYEEYTRLTFNVANAGDTINARLGQITIAWNSLPESYKTIWRRIARVGTSPSEKPAPALNEKTPLVELYQTWAKERTPPAPFESFAEWLAARCTEAGYLQIAALLGVQ